MIERARSPIGLLLIGLATLLVVGVLSTVGQTAAEIGQGWVPGVGELEPPQPEGEEPIDPFEDVDTPPLLRNIMSIMLIIVLLVLGVMVVFGLIVIIIGFHTSRVRRARHGVSAITELPDDDEADATLVARAARRARDVLFEYEAGEPGDAVVRAWLLLEQACADAGTSRRPHQTPTEFTTEVFTGLRVDPDTLGRLRRLYQRARFSSRPVTDDDVTQARAALDRLIADLDSRASRTEAPA